MAMPYGYLFNMVERFLLVQWYILQPVIIRFNIVKHNTAEEISDSSS